jgi:hypothetical protein
MNALRGVFLWPDSAASMRWKKFTHLKTEDKKDMKKYDLQLFADGGEGGSGAQGGSAGAGNGGQGGNAGSTGSNKGGNGFSYEQAEEIASARAERAEKAALSSYFKQQGMTEEEVQSALAAYKTQKAASQPNVDAITKERDTALAELAAYKNGATLRSKGVRDEDIDYVMFKVSALQKEDDKLDFDKAVSKFLKDNPRFATGSQQAYRVKTGTDGSTPGGSGNQGDNSSINDAIRRAIRR